MVIQMHVIEALAGDRRRLNERIEGLSAHVETPVQHDPACRRSSLLVCKDWRGDKAVGRRIVLNDA